MWNVCTSYTYIHNIIRIRYHLLSFIYLFAFPIELNFITFVRRSGMVVDRLFLLQNGQTELGDIKVISLSAYFFNFFSVLLYVYRCKNYFWCKILKWIRFIRTIVECCFIGLWENNNAFRKPFRLYRYPFFEMSKYDITMLVLEIIERSDRDA